MIVAYCRDASTEDYCAYIFTAGGAFRSAARASSSAKLQTLVEFAIGELSLGPVKDVYLGNLDKPTWSELWELVQREIAK